MKPFDIWNRYMQSYDFLTTVDGYNRNLQDILQTVSPKAGVRILDAGSGTGNLSVAMKRSGAVVSSCDFSPSAIEAHLKKDPNADVVNASLEEPLPFDDGSFDAVACASVLFALTRDGCRLAMREFHRVLAADGRAVVTVPAREARLTSLVRMHFSTQVRRHGMVIGAARSIRDVPVLTNVLRYNRLLMSLPDWEGFHIFTEDELRSSLREAGFGEISITRTYGDCFLLATARKQCPAEIVARKMLEAA
jgi:ubiquinone/menaquinone biosynthesis C-methylase UbiE